MAKVDDINSLELPEGFEWGQWSGDYRTIHHDGERIGAFGGLLALVTPPDELQSTLNNEVARMLIRHGQVRFRANPNAKPISAEEAFKRAMEQYPKTMAYLAKH